MKRRNVLTCAGGGGSAEQAFTMAEILLSLTIIGVVAAITLPSLTGNINERTWNTQRKALYSRMSQAISLMPALNGYGTTDENAAETFVTAGLSKVLKINNICDNEHLKDCGIPEKLTPTSGGTMSIPTKLSELNELFTGSYTDAAGLVYENPQKNIDTKAAAFETANGESIVVFYNPHCTNDMNEITWHYPQPKMCANFVYDLNGSKGPNTVGKDIGVITALYPTDSVVVAPVLPPNYVSSNGLMTHPQAVSACKGQDSENRLPNRYEAASMFYNKNLFGLFLNVGLWTSSMITLDNGNVYVWVQELTSGRQGPLHRTAGGHGVWCIRR